MVEWSVSIDAHSGSAFDESDAEAMIDALAPYAPAVSYGNGEVTARFTLVSDSALEAMNKALTFFGTTSLGHDVFRVEAQPAEDVGRELNLAVS